MHIFFPFLRMIKPNPQGSAGNLTLSIAATRGSDQVAPEGIWFEATPGGFDVSPPTGGDVYDPTYHDILYVWTFDDVGTFTAPVNIPSSWDDKNVGYGRHVSHVFDTPGNYTVICTAYDRSGNSKADSTIITVKNPDTVWATTKTICVALDSVYTNAPTGSDNYNTMAAAETAYKALGSTGRLLLKTGGTYSFADTRIRNAYPNFHLGSFNSGANPIIDTTFWFDVDMSTSKDTTVSGLDLIGGWDASTESTSSGLHKGLEVKGTNHCTFYDMNLSGLSISVHLAADNGTYIFQEMDITNWQDYGALLKPQLTGKVGFKGCAAAQNVDALGGNKGKNVNHNSHGPMRWSGNLPGDATKGYFGVVDLFSNNGWSASGGSSHQAPFRTSGGNSDMFLNFDRISSEGGGNQLALHDTAGGSESLPTNILVDKFITVAGDTCQDSITLGLGATTLRNGVIVKADAPSKVGTGWRACLSYRDSGDDAQNLAEPIKVYNVSFVNLLTDANDTGGGGAQANFITTNAGVFTTEIRDNNIEHMPNSVLFPDTGDAPLVTAALFTPRYKGFRWEDAPVLDTAFATPAATPALYSAASGSAAENNATTGVISIDDIYGTLRPATADRGSKEI